MSFFLIKLYEFEFSLKSFQLCFLNLWYDEFEFSLEFEFELAICIWYEFLFFLIGLVETKENCLELFLGYFGGSLMVLTLAGRLLL